MELYLDLRAGHIETEFEFPKDQDEEDKQESAIEDYDEFRARRRSFIARYGAATYDKMELIWKRSAQEAILTTRRLNLRTISALLGPRYSASRRYPELASIRKATSSMVRSVYDHPFMSVDFGARAVKAGESEEFKERVRTGLMKAKTRNLLLHPLLAPCGITVFYLPPRDASKIDLDNLMREAIIPAVHEMLQPPATGRELLLSLNADSMEPLAAEMIRRYKNAPRFHVTGYEGFCLPRTTGDPENGNVRLVLHGGESWRSTWDMLDSTLTEWAEAEGRRT